MWCINHVPPDKIEEWLHNLNAPLPGEAKKPVRPQDWEDDGSFMTAMATLKGG